MSTSSFSRSPRGSPLQWRGASSSGTTLSSSRPLSPPGRRVCVRRRACGPAAAQRSRPEVAVAGRSRHGGCLPSAAGRSRAAPGAAAAGRRRQESSRWPKLILKRLARAMTARGLVAELVRFESVSIDHLYAYVAHQRISSPQRSSRTDNSASQVPAPSPSLVLRVRWARRCSTAGGGRLDDSAQHGDSREERKHYSLQTMLASWLGGRERASLRAARHRGRARCALASLRTERLNKADWWKV
jgi:hypothetical protein